MFKKNRQNIRQNGQWEVKMFLKVGRQPGGAHNRHQETPIN